MPNYSCTSSSIAFVLDSISAAVSDPYTNAALTSELLSVDRSLSPLAKANSGVSSFGLPDMNPGPYLKANYPNPAYAYMTTLARKNGSFLRFDWSSASKNTFIAAETASPTSSGT